jgi:hypothetical protein
MATGYHQPAATPSGVALARRFGVGYGAGMTNRLDHDDGAGQPSEGIAGEPVVSALAAAINELVALKDGRIAPDAFATWVTPPSAPNGVRLLPALNYGERMDRLWAALAAAGHDPGARLDYIAWGGGPAAGPTIRRPLPGWTPTISTTRSCGCAAASGSATAIGWNC